MALQVAEITENDDLIYYGVQVKDANGTLIKGASCNFDMGSSTSHNNGGGVKTTNSRGVASTWISREEAPPKISCSVEKTGYFMKTVLCTGNPGVIYTPVVLESIPDEYYCAISVVDSDTNEPVKGATVKIYDSSNVNEGVIVPEQTTDVNGKINPVPCPANFLGFYFKVTKNGYLDSDLTFVPKRSSTSSVTIISLKKTKAGNYYYNIQVNNEDGSPYTGGGEIRLYNDFSLSTPCTYCSLVQPGSDEAKKEILYDLKEIISDVMNIEEVRIKATSKFSDFGCDSLDGFDILRRIEEEYNISISTQAAGNLIYVSDLVNLVSDMYFAPVNPVMYKTIYDIGPTGFVSVQRLNLSSIPKTVYVKGLPFDTSSSHEWIISSGPVTPSTEEDRIGLTLTVKSNSTIDTSYYHNVTVKDWCLGTPIRDVAVTYTQVSNEIGTFYTDNSGNVSLKSGFASLTLSFSKDGYVPFSTNLFGLRDPSQYNVIRLSPMNTIKVVYGNDCLTPGPAAGILVSIGSYDDLGKYVEIVKFNTNQDGYVPTLSNSYFTANRYVAVVLNYVPENSSAVYSLKRTLTTGENLITLPKRKIEEEVEEDYVTFYDQTANAIKKNVNDGNKELANQNSSQKVSYSDDTFRINILDPDSITTYDIFESYPVIMNNNQKSVIGSVDMGLKPDANNLKLKVVNRYSGYYNPIFKDILFYNNMTVDDEQLPFSNTSFDPTYEDKYGKFGVIRNMWFHKVNDNKDVEIFNTLTPYYPLTGQYALDFRDYNVFESNWDINHFVRQLDVNTSESCQNISSMKNGICMFGSKYLNVPEVIEIYGFDMGDDPSWTGKWNDDWITNPDGCPGELMFKEVNDNSVDFYFFLKKRILRFFYDKLKEEFESYMNPEDRSFGKPGVEDDIKEYVTKNVLKLYKLEKVRMFVKRTKKGQHNSMIENDYTSYLDEYDYNGSKPEQRTAGYFIRKGFVEVNTVTMTKMNRDDFDRKLVYNLRNGSQEDFGFGFILKKI